jgi:hypothetical protein
MMQARMAFGWKLLVVSSLLVLAACANATPPVAGNAATGTTRVAGVDPGSGGTNSVTAVSDALGQRLDGMLMARQTSH